MVFLFELSFLLIRVATEVVRTNCLAVYRARLFEWVGMEVSLSVPGLLGDPTGSV